MKVNVGCGSHPLLYWDNIDSDGAAFADKYVSVPPMPYGDGEVDEIFAGHFLEHLTQEEAVEFLAECRRVLVPKGKLGIVVPDTEEVMRRHFDHTADGRVQYPKGTWLDVHDLNDMCHLFLYSTAQDSHHQWSYNHNTLARLLVANGFSIAGEINRWMDPRITVGAWYQFGLDAVKM